MSIVERARSSAGATLEQSKSAVGIVSSRVRALPADTRVLTRTAASTAGRQAYAALGAGDAIAATVTRQREELPAKFVETTRARVKAATERATTTQQTIASTAVTLLGRSVEVATSVRKITPTATLGQAKDAFAKLAVRGEQVATDLRHDPALVRVIRRADGRVENVANGVTSVAQKVRARVSEQARREARAATSTPVRVTPANKVPTHRTTVRETPAAEAAVSTTPTHRAAAKKTAARSAAAKEAAATRKAAADKAAATRKAAAKKAAATRKKTADTRHTAAVKAAATRKKNAAKA